MNEKVRKEFLARWIPYGLNLMMRAESFGIDWKSMSLEKLEAAVIFAEEFATPDQYKTNFQRK